MSTQSIPVPLSATQQQVLGEICALYQPPVLAIPAASKPLRIGLIADPQYADVEPNEQQNLYYHQTLRKLAMTIDQLNALELDFVVTLGDLIDRDWASYPPLLAQYARLRHPHIAVLGNHDAQVISSRLAEQTPVLALPKSYYQFTLPGYRFIVIDGNDISLFCNAGNGDERQQAKAILADLTARQQLQAKPWNGAVGAQQLAWLEQNLQHAKQDNETVIVFGHFPLAPQQEDNLWNYQEVAALFCRYSVAAYFCGHTHRNGYAEIEGCEFITLEGMLLGPDAVPFAIAEFENSKLSYHFQRMTLPQE